MVDFFNEVEEDLRADRLRSLTRTFLPWVIAAVAALVIGVAGVWGYTAWREHSMAKASEAYERGLKALGEGRTAQADVAFSEAAKAGSGAYESLALQQRAGILVAAGKPDQALPLLDQAAKASKEPILADVARLKAAFLVMDKGDHAKVEERLKPLIEKGRPYRIIAREALALTRLAAGNATAARTDFVTLSVDPAATDDIRARAQAAIQMIDSGQTGQLAAIAKAAAAQPPAPAFNPYAQPGQPGLPPGAVAQ